MSVPDQAPSLAVPAGWSPSDATLAPPDLSQSPQIRLEAWHVATRHDATLVTACFVGHADGWPAEADAIALQKLEGIAASTYLRLGVQGGLTPVAQADGDVGPVRTRTLDGPLAHARTWLAFEADGAVHGCFAECVRPDEACRAAVDGARLEGAFVPPPAPSAWMRAVALAVHHPGTAAATFAALAVVLGVVAVLTRRRPRHRP